MYIEFLIQLLNVASLMIAVVATFYMHRLSQTVSEKRLHSIFRGLKFTFAGVSLAVLGGILQEFFNLAIMRTLVDVMVLFALGGLVTIVDDVDSFAEEYSKINEKVQKFSSEKNKGQKEGDKEKEDEEEKGGRQVS